MSVFLNSPPPSLERLNGGSLSGGNGREEGGRVLRSLVDLWPKALSHNSDEKEPSITAALPGGRLVISPPYSDRESAMLYTLLRMAEELFPQFCFMSELCAKSADEWRVREWREKGFVVSLLFNSEGGPAGAAFKRFVSAIGCGKSGGSSLFFNSEEEPHLGLKRAVEEVASKRGGVGERLQPEAIFLKGIAASELSPRWSPRKGALCAKEKRSAFPQLANLVQQYLQQVSKNVCIEVEKKMTSEGRVKPAFNWQQLSGEISQQLPFVGSPRFKQAFSPRLSLPVSYIEQVAKRCMDVVGLVDFLEEKKLARNMLGELPWHSFQRVIRSRGDRELFLSTLERGKEIGDFLEEVLERKEENRYLLSRKGIFNALLLEGYITDSEEFTSRERAVLSPKSGKEPHRVGEIVNRVVRVATAAESSVSFTLYNADDHTRNISIASPRYRCRQLFRAVPVEFSCIVPTELVEKLFEAVARGAKYSYYMRLKAAVVNSPPGRKWALPSESSSCVAETASEGAAAFSCQPKLFSFSLEGGGSIQAYRYDPSSESFLKLGPQITESASGLSIEELEEESFWLLAKCLLEKLEKEAASMSYNLLWKEGMPLLSVTLPSHSAVIFPLYIYFQEYGARGKKEWELFCNRVARELKQLDLMVNLAEELSGRTTYPITYTPGESLITFTPPSKRTISVESSKLFCKEVGVDKAKLKEKLELILFVEGALDQLRDFLSVNYISVSFDHSALTLKIRKNSARDKSLVVREFFSEALSRGSMKNFIKKLKAAICEK